MAAAPCVELFVLVALAESFAGKNRSSAAFAPSSFAAVAAVA